MSFSTHPSPQAPLHTPFSTSTPPTAQLNMHIEVYIFRQDGQFNCLDGEADMDTRYTGFSAFSPTPEVGQRNKVKVTCQHHIHHYSIWHALLELGRNCAKPLARGAIDTWSK